MQVLRATAIDLGLVDSGISQEDYAALAYSLSDFTLIYWGTKVFANKLQRVGGDELAAVTAYNGSGAAADAYASSVEAFINSTYGNG
jgi:hypothetical protein